MAETIDILLKTGNHAFTFTLQEPAGASSLRIPPGSLSPKSCD